MGLILLSEINLVITDDKNGAHLCLSENDFSYHHSKAPKVKVNKGDGSVIVIDGGMTM